MEYKQQTYQVLHFLFVMTHLFVQQQKFVLFAIKQIALVLDYLDIPFNNSVQICWSYLGNTKANTRYTLTFPHVFKQPPKCMIQENYGGNTQKVVNLLQSTTTPASLQFYCQGLLTYTTIMVVCLAIGS